MPSRRNVLIVGGSGYIGSHMTRLLLKKNFNPIIFDRILPKKRLSGVACVKGDLRNFKAIDSAIRKYTPKTVMYFGGLIIAPESVKEPLKYYDYNVSAAVNLFRSMQINQVYELVFSSTAAVYGNTDQSVLTEQSPLQPINPYGSTKLMVEQMIHDVAVSNKNFKYVILRYFNAAGADPSAEIGEDHHPETHLIPNVLRTIKGQHKELVVYGNDYKTADGTCIRDYIHVDDLCRAHYLALKAMSKVRNSVFNLGSGRGYSVKEIIAMAEAITGKKVNVRIGPRREGDPSKLIASSKKAFRELGWKPQYGLKEIIATAWNWEKNLG